MQNNIAKQIRTHRLRCNLTQEKLAAALNVTSQAVSKWENGLSYPDISILPELSAILGTTIDALFESGTETHLKRIDKMIYSEVKLSKEDFEYAENFLKEGCLKLDTKKRCLTMLGNLYNQRALAYREKAVEIAKIALEVEPENHENHAILCEGMDGTFLDWCITNHSRVIDYYKDYTKKHPSDRAGYMWLIDNLVADGRFAEANEALEKLRSIKETYHYLLYKAYIAQYEFGWEAAEPYLQEMIEMYGNDEHAWNERASLYAKRGQFDKAIADFEMAAGLEQSPRYVDNYLSIAQIATICGDKKKAIEAYRKVIEIYREDWETDEGEVIREYLQKIADLQKEQE
ncbi:MAG: helix-turn-helix domain-containing protein [Ruminococcaceae bacterium]|nr:helix-turn-helix domain-containing protein [Oscillospiraceae bacterium]